MATRAMLARSLKKLGLAAGDAVMIDVAPDAVGHIVGGPDEIVEALLGVVGTGGTIAMHIGWDDAPSYGPYSLGAMPSDWAEAYREQWPPFSADRSRADRRRGVLAEYIRTWPGARRSQNPLASVAAIGGHAHDVTFGHALSFGYGERSPWAKLCAMGGKVLCAGVPLSELSILHHAESKAKVSNKRVAEYVVPILRDGHRAMARVEEHDTHNGVVDWAGGDYFDPLMHAALEHGLARTGRLGDTAAHVLEAPALVRFAVEWLETHL